MAISWCICKSISFVQPTMYLSIYIYIEIDTVLFVLYIYDVDRHSQSPMKTSGYFITNKKCWYSPAIKHTSSNWKPTIYRCVLPLKPPLIENFPASHVWLPEGLCVFFISVPACVSDVVIGLVVQLIAETLEQLVCSLWIAGRTPRRQTHLRRFVGGNCSSPCTS